MPAVCHLCYHSYWHWFLLNLCWLSCQLSAQEQYIFQGCESRPREHLSFNLTHGATVKSGHGESYNWDSNSSCTVILQARPPADYFLLKLDSLEVFKHFRSTECTDSLSIHELSPAYNVSSVILDQFCGPSKEVPWLRTSGHLIRIIWSTRKRQGSTDGLPQSNFSLTTTAVASGLCPPERALCGEGQCIDRSLFCDGVVHCPDGSDEICRHKRQVNATNHTVKEISAVRTTPRPSATTKRPKKRPTLPGDSIAITDNDIYLWLPLIAVVIFTAIMVILVMVGRQKRDNAGYTAQRNPSGGDATSVNMTSVRTTTTATTTTTTAAKTTESTAPGSVDIITIVTVLVIFTVTLLICAFLGCHCKKQENQGEDQVSLAENGLTQLDLNSNAAYQPSEGMPETPPPTYSFIERQTSYVSQISQDSSQISVPPEYEDALEFPDLPNGEQPARRSSNGSTQQANTSSNSGSSGGGPRTSSSSGGGPPPRRRFRLFSRSASANEPRRDRASRLSSTLEEPEPSTSNVNRTHSDLGVVLREQEAAAETSDVVFVDPSNLVFEASPDPAQPVSPGGATGSPALNGSPRSAAENDSVFALLPDVVTTPAESRPSFYLSS